VWWFEKRRAEEEIDFKSLRAEAMIGVSVIDVSVLRRGIQKYEEI
jgi:hypothetical protein